MKQDYASDIVAFRRRPGGDLVGLLDCYTRTKTKALVLKYALAHPDTQLPPERRCEVLHMNAHTAPRLPEGTGCGER